MNNEQDKHAVTRPGWTAPEQAANARRNEQAAHVLEEMLKRRERAERFPVVTDWEERKA